MSFADSWHWASCALLLLTLHFSMFSFYPPFHSLSLLLSLSLSLFLSLSLYLCPLFLSVVARHMSSDALYQIFSSWSILLFHTISFHSSYKIHQLFTDYLLRLPSSELLEKHLFRSRANRRLVSAIVDRIAAGRIQGQADWGHLRTNSTQWCSDVLWRIPSPVWKASPRPPSLGVAVASALLRVSVVVQCLILTAEHSNQDKWWQVYSWKS